MGWFTMTSVDHVSSSDWEFPVGRHTLKAFPNLFWPCHIEALIPGKGWFKRNLNSASSDQFGLSSDHLLSLEKSWLSA